MEHLFGALIGAGLGGLIGGAIGGSDFSRRHPILGFLAMLAALSGLLIVILTGYYIFG